MKHPIQAARKSERELVSSRIIPAPPRAVFDAWSNPEVFRKWWVPASMPMTLERCDMDVRAGGAYRLAFRAGVHTAEFFGQYREVIPGARLVWTNDEGGPDAATITTVTFEESEGGTLVTVVDLFPSKPALDEAIATGSAGALPEQLAQLEHLMAGRGAS